MDSHAVTTKVATPASRSGAEASSNQLSEKAKKHLAFLHRVFKRLTWLEIARKASANPVFLGCDVSAVYEGRDEPAYLILLSMDWTYTIADLGEQALLDCLQDFDVVEDGLIRIRNTNIMLNISDAVEGHADHTNVSSINRVLRDDHTTSALYYTDCDEPQHLETTERELTVVTRNGGEEERWTSKTYLVDLPFCPHPDKPGENLAWCIKEPYPPHTSLCSEGKEYPLSPYSVGTPKELSEDESI